MGVKGLWGLLNPAKKQCSLKNLSGQTVAVDLSIWVCEDESVRQMQGVVAKPYIRNLFFRVSHLLQLGISVVVVVEGQAPKVKWDEMARRQQTRGRKRGQSTVSGPSRPQHSSKLRECCELLQSLGVPFVVAEGEAEAMCACLNDAGIVDGCITDDGDAFLYGAKVVYKNFTMTSKDAHVEVYKMEVIKEKLGLTRGHLVALALLLGCDYVPKGVPGVGLETALKLFDSLRGRDILARFDEWRKGQQRGISRIEQSVRDKALAVREFPFYEVVSEFLNSKERAPQNQQRWQRPIMHAFQVYVMAKLEWELSYSLDKVLPLVTLWDQRAILEGRTDSQERLQPARIIKKRISHGKPVFEVEWIKPASSPVLPEDKTWVTLEDQVMFGSCFPQVVEEFSASEGAVRKRRKKVTERKAGSTQDDIISRMSRLELKERMAMPPAEPLTGMLANMAKTRQGKAAAAASSKSEPARFSTDMEASISEFVAATRQETLAKSVNRRDGAAASRDVPVSVLENDATQYGASAALAPPGTGATCLRWSNTTGVLKSAATGQETLSVVLNQGDGAAHSARSTLLLDEDFPESLSPDFSRNQTVASLGIGYKYSAPSEILSSNAQVLLACQRSSGEAEKQDHGDDDDDYEDDDNDDDNSDAEEEILPLRLRIQARLIGDKSNPTSRNDSREAPPCTSSPGLHATPHCSADVHFPMQNNAPIVIDLTEEEQDSQDSDDECHLYLSPSLSEEDDCGSPGSQDWAWVGEELQSAELVSCWDLETRTQPPDPEQGMSCQNSPLASDLSIICKMVESQSTPTVRDASSELTKIFYLASSTARHGAEEALEESLERIPTVYEEAEFLQGARGKWTDESGLGDCTISNEWELVSSLDEAHHGDSAFLQPYEEEAEVEHEESRAETFGDVSPDFSHVNLSAMLLTPDLNSVSLATLCRTPSSKRHSMASLAHPNMHHTPRLCGSGRRSGNIFANLEYGNFALEHSLLRTPLESAGDGASMLDSQALNREEGMVISGRLNNNFSSPLSQNPRKGESEESVSPTSFHLESGCLRSEPVTKSKNLEVYSLVFDPLEQVPVFDGSLGTVVKTKAAVSAVTEEYLEDSMLDPPSPEIPSLAERLKLKLSL